MNTVKWTWIHTLVTILLAGAVLIGVFARRADLSLFGLWGGLMLCFAVFIVITGHGITGCWRGAFIDDRNVISLSRFQMLAWTVLILSAFMAAALWNISLHLPQPLDVLKLEPSLWMLMGISTASLVASPLILSGKKAQQPDAQQMGQVFELLKDKGEGEATNQGLVVTNRDIRQARWTDMFTGEETGNAAHLDLARVQMFAFTIVALLTYGVALAEVFRQPDILTKGVTEFPKLSEGLLALIGISHVGYLAHKAAPVSKTGQGDGSGQPPAADDDTPAQG